MTLAPLKKAFTPSEFRAHLEDNRKKMNWKPKGVVLHNTWAPTLKQTQDYISSGKWSFDQLIENWYTRYRKLGWSSGPHFFIMPDERGIWVASPVWNRGTHSPSFNSAYWAIELVGEYATEILPPALRKNGVACAAALYKFMGLEPSLQNFKFHGEDPRTTHKACPGRNVGPKDQWVREVKDYLASPHGPVTDLLARPTEPPANADALLRLDEMEEAIQKMLQEIAELRTTLEARKA